MTVHVCVSPALIFPVAGFFQKKLKALIAYFFVTILEDLELFRLERHLDLLRKSIRKLVIRESELLDSFATAQMEQEIQSKVIETTKKLSNYISHETGIESSLKEEDIEKYCKQVLAELKRK